MVFARLAFLAAPALATYTEDKALTYAHLCAASMCSYPNHDDTALLNWECGPACQDVPGMSNVFIVNKTKDDAFMYGGRITNPKFTVADQCVLVFRGTSDTAGWMQDFKSLTLDSLPKAGIPCAHKGKDCLVGSGFIANYLDLAAGIKENLKRIGCDSSQPLAITGHSLGAAEATLAMWDLSNEGYNVIESYTFGQPRVGDVTFKAAFEAKFGDIEPFRVTHSNDPIVQTPFTKDGFVHLATEVYYKKTSKEGFVVCDGSGEDETCADSRSGEFISAGLVCVTNPSKCAHLTYLQPANEIMMNGDSCTSAKASISV